MGVTRPLARARAVVIRSWITRVAVGLAPILVLALLVAACGVPSRPVSLASLAADQASYQGQEVTTQGVVHRFTDPTGPYFLIEDAADNRVEVVPAAEIAKYEGRQVAVTGKFDFVPNTGRVIHIHHVSLASG